MADIEDFQTFVDNATTVCYAKLRFVISQTFYIFKA